MYDQAAVVARRAKKVIDISLRKARRLRQGLPARLASLVRGPLPPFRRRPLIEALEPRVLLSADSLVPTIEGSLDVPGEVDRYGFVLENATRVVFDSLTQDSNKRWSLTGPEGALVTDRRFDQSDSVNQSGTVAFDLMPGDYTLTVDGAGDNTGAYSFRLLDLGQADEITPGTPQEGRLEPGRETDAYQFSVVAGSKFYFDRTLGVESGAYWRLLDPFGRNVWGPTSMGGDVGETLMQYDGAYTLLIEGRVSNGTPMDYRFNVVPVVETTVPVEVGATVMGTLASAGARVLHTFTLDSERTVLFDSLVNRSDVQWSLIGPRGTVVGARGLHQSDANAWNTNTALALGSGDYTLVIDGVDDAVGDYAFSLLDLTDGGQLQRGVPVSGIVGDVGQTAARMHSTAGAPLDGVDPATNRSLLVDGGTTYVTAGTAPALEATNQLTVEAWIRPTGNGTDGTYGGIIVNREGEYEIARFPDGSIRWAFANSSLGWQWYDTGIVAKAGEWTHVAVVYDNGTVRTYRNGELAHTQQGTGAIGDVSVDLDDFRIGGRQSTPYGQNFAGAIDEVRVWNTARTAAEIRENHERVLSGAEAGLQGYWRFEESADAVPGMAGDQVLDLSANGNHGTLANQSTPASENNASFTFGEPLSGAAMVSDFGTGRYRIEFSLDVGATLDLPSSVADESIASATLGGAPVVIPVGDIDGDGSQDSVVASRQNVLDPATGQRVHAVTIALGNAPALQESNGSWVDTRFSIVLPAPLVTTAGTSGSRIFAAGDVDGDGIGDLAVSVLGTAASDGLYLLFGRGSWSNFTLAPESNDSQRYFAGDFAVGAAGDVTPVIGQGLDVTIYSRSAPDALVFDGNDRIEIPASSVDGGPDTLGLSADASIEMRLRLDVPVGGDGKFDFGGDAVQRMALLERVDVAEGRTFSLWVDLEGRLTAGSSRPDGSFDGAQSAAGAVTAGRWFDLALVMDRTTNTLAIYVDGVALDLVTQNSPGQGFAVPEPQSLIVGGTGSAAPDVTGLIGQIDEVAAWSAALTGAEIAAHREQGFDAEAAGLQGWWRFAEGAGFVAADSSTGGNDGWLGGIPAEGSSEPADPNVVPQRSVAVIDKDLTQSTELVTGADRLQLGDLNRDFTVRTSGTLFVDHDGPVTFFVTGAGSSRLRIDGDVVAAVAMQGGGQSFTVDLDRGYRDIVLDTVSEGDVGVSLQWNPDGGSTGQAIAQDRWVRTTAGPNDTTLQVYDDLVFANSTSATVLHGRPREAWIDASVPAAFAQAVAGTQTTGVGDALGDAREDFVTLAGDTLTVRSGGSIPGQDSGLLSAVVTGTLDHPFAGLQVARAGDLDGDLHEDVLLTGTGGSYVIFSSGLQGTRAIDTLIASGKAAVLSSGAFTAAGDVNGDGIDDLAGTVLERSNGLDGADVEHTVVHVYLGDTDRTALVAKLAGRNGVVTPDIVLEPAIAQYAAAGALSPATARVGTLGTVAHGGVARSILAVASPDALRLYAGLPLETTPESVLVGAGPAQPVERFRFELATPLSTRVVSNDPEGQTISAGQAADASQATGFQGSSAGERLSETYAIGDVSGDGREDYFVGGTDRGYIVFGPVSPQGMGDISLEADLIVDGALGRLASGGGDVNGDGVDDLVFVSDRHADNTRTLTLIHGGLGLPRELTADWVTSVGTSRVRTLTLGTALQGTGDAAVSLLDWNADGHADVLLTTSSATNLSAAGTMSRVLSGERLMAGIPSQMLMVRNDRTSTTDGILAAAFGRQGAATSAAPSTRTA